MTPTKELREVIRRALDVPRVVGAGLGARPVSDPCDSRREPVLTVMVDSLRPGDNESFARALGRGNGPPVEVIEVGKVTALVGERPDKKT
ncbi:MAG TPA: hypothetical protein GX512_07970 [Firmicutes bacterium]|nr:hypothetical protein [Candidatus Fermentithermobacillaceae bacterium]